MTTKRITQSDIEALADRINILTNNHREYTDKASSTFKSNDGHYMIHYAYGGVKLVQVVGEGGGIREITYGYTSKRELYYKMCSLFPGAVH